MAENKVTYLCVVRLLLDSTTVLEGLSENTTPHQQHWVNNVWVIGGEGGQQQHPNVTDV